MNEVTRNVILDMLPLYLAGEVSEDTSALVKKYLDSDPELAEMAQQAAKVNSLNEVPAPLSKELAMEKFEEAKRWTVIKTLGLATIIAGMFLCVFLSILFFYGVSLGLVK
jgi:uncharacterized membrane-anchored protein YitT (DUF2179 family)